MCETSKKLEDYILITNEEYNKLENPIFVGQTKIDYKGGYYMCWECDGKLYKTYNTL